MVEAAEGWSSGWVMAGIVGAQALLSLALLARGGWRKSAASDAKRDGEIDALVRQLARVADGLERQVDKHNEHVLDDARIHERLTVVQEQTVQATVAIHASLDSHQAQINNVARDLAAVAERRAAEVPASGLHRRR